MKRSVKYFGLAFCLLNLSLAGSALAARSEEALDRLEENSGQTADGNTQEQDCQLFLVKRDAGLRVADMDAGESLDTLHLYITGAEGKIIRNAQVVANVIDGRGEQQLSRAIPYKGGYTLAIDHLAAGQYLVEVEIIARGELLTNLFRFSKA